MYTKQLFPHKFKMIGWIILIPSLIMGIAWMYFKFRPEFLTMNVPSIFDGDADNGFSRWKIKNITGDIAGMGILFGALFIINAKEKMERTDDYLNKFRYNGMTWAFRFEIFWLLATMPFIHQFSYLRVMVIALFAPMLIYIVRYHYLLITQKPLKYEEQVEGAESNS